MNGIKALIFAAALVALSANAENPSLNGLDERLTSLSLEVKALQKENDLLTASLKDNWVAFSSQCGKILATEECQEDAKAAEKDVECIDSKKKAWMDKPHHAEGRKLKGRGGKHHGGKHHGGKHHGGKHHGGKHHGGKHHGEKGKPEMPSFTKATYCVLKQAYMTDAKVPVSAHCKRAAQRFELYQSVHRKPHPPRRDHRGPPHAHFVVMLLIGLIIGLSSCCIAKCMRKRCKKRTNAATVQAQTTGVVYMGQPVVVTSSSPGVTVEKA